MIDPNFGGLGYSLRRFYVDRFYHRQLAELPVGSHLLDLGGNRLQKRGQFNVEEFDVRMVYANLVVDKKPQVQADGAYLPFPAATFDAVICSEVLEHVPFPEQVIGEAYRVLRPGGRLLMSVPFLYHLHGDPYDYGRYTDHYWHERLSAAGFKAIELEWQGYFWSVVVDMFRAVVSMNAQRGRPRLRLLRKSLASLMSAGKKLALRWDAKTELGDNEVARKFTTGFGIVGYK